MFEHVITMNEIRTVAPMLSNEVLHHLDYETMEQLIDNLQGMDGRFRRISAENLLGITPELADFIINGKEPENCDFYANGFFGIPDYHGDILSMDAFDTMLHLSSFEQADLVKEQRAVLTNHDQFLKTIPAFHVYLEEDVLDSFVPNDPSPSWLENL